MIPTTPPVLNFKTPIQEEINQLSAKVKSKSKWDITLINLGEHHIHLFMCGSMAKAISYLSAKLDSEALLKCTEDVSKIQAKIDFANKIIKYLLEGNTGVDPRIEKLMGKLKNSPESFTTEKHEKYTKQIELLAMSHPNRATQFEIKIAQTIMKQLILESPPIKCGSSVIEILPSSKTESQELKDLKLAVCSLNNSIKLLSTLSDEGFNKAIKDMENLDDLKFLFPIKIQGFPAGDHNPFYRSCIHLYHIQKNETPEKIITPNHFILAFSNLSFKTTHQQRLRAAERTQVELLTLLIEICLRYGDQASLLPKVIEMLEELNLDAKDLPEGQKNPARFLFDTLHIVYSETRSQMKQLRKPSDPCFKGDFGREAMIGESSGYVSHSFKFQALEKFKTDLQHTWKI